MILASATWKEVQDFNREAVVLIPTGSLEQHGPHLPLFTDSLLAAAVAERTEQRLPGDVLLLPTLWLGASGHHLAFPGSLSASFETYEGAIIDAVESLIPHAFTKFYVLNGHGGNSEPNGVAMRKLKGKYPYLSFGHSGYFTFVAEVAAQILKGPTKEMRHSCEAEVSLMMHLYPDLVRTAKLRDDGLAPNPPVRGVIHHFDELSEEGSLGHATFATAETGKALFEAAVEGVCREIKTIAEGYVLEAL